MKKSRINVHGDNNELIIHPETVLNQTVIHILGNNNRVEIAPHCILTSAELIMEKDKNRIVIQKDVRVAGSTQFAALEGTSIEVGEGCMFSSNIIIRTGDSHPIYSSINHERVNEAKNVMLEDRVWICEGARVLKGALVGKDCIVGTQAVVTGQFVESGCVLAGIPAKVVKRGVEWAVAEGAYKKRLQEREGA